MIQLLRVYYFVFPAVFYQEAKILMRRQNVYIYIYYSRIIEKEYFLGIINHLFH